MTSHHVKLNFVTLRFRPQHGFRICIEQVSHHPPISAIHAESTTGLWRLNVAIHPKLSFWGKHISVTPKGQVTVELYSRKEIYTWNHADVIIHNIIIGTIWIERVGTIKIVNHSNKHKVQLNFKKCGWFGTAGLHRVEGCLTNNEKKKLVSLYGKWNQVLYSTDPQTYELHLANRQGEQAEEKNGKEEKWEEGDDEEKKPDEKCPEITRLPNSTELWLQERRLEKTEENYFFSHFTMLLNEQLSPERMRTLPPTDCRFRPDMRYMEMGDLDGATAAKSALEEKQRETTYRMKKSGEHWKPRWFKECTHPQTGNSDWIYVGGYWDRNFTRCPDIF
ncbi:PREDICTED: oxysterol-binding protein-related protein 1-like [Priapulus caudatus]|uniref:Oxysterol-binding protein n=1 Tax=Priapulus caudatus TaxID=37621 RepID=A0ABM1ETA2_PRICU|nr:PREDICTED: oxysterol-binding protein-related protein 1-like [Priapulus caudatus]